MMGKLVGLVALAAICAGACDSDSRTENQVFFVGYVYDGATGARLPKTSIEKVSIIYGTKTIKVDVADDGRFSSVDPLPTWRDYTVKIDAAGYRAFASYNTGVDVPASLAMTNGVAQAQTVQTLDFSAFLYPVDLKSPKFTLTVTAPDPVTAAPVSDKVNGTARLRPVSAPGIQIGATAGTTPAKRVWANGEDLLTQSVIKDFMNGTVTVDVGELVYGVAYEVTIYDVPGFQPLVTTTAGQSNQGIPTAIVAGSVTSMTLALTPETQDPLRIVNIDNATCVPPAPTATTYGGKITLTFNADIEVLSSTLAEDIDNAFQVSTSQLSTYCPIKTPTGDPAQERGSKVEITGNTMSFSFNPSVGFATMGQWGTACTLPPSITTITYYQGTPSINVQAKGNASRKASLSSLLSAKLGSSVLSCPVRTF